MASYPTTKLDKALARRGASSTSRPAWQELMERHDTVPSKSIQGPDVIQGFSGSWASTYELGGSVRDGSVGESPAQVQRRINRLGQPGMAEINFRPYDHGTTRHGKYGPSLLGHPISFQVVGPTAKNRELIHQWYIVENVGGWDELHLDVNASVNSTTTAPDPLVAGLDTLKGIYNLDTLLLTKDLYLVVSMTGSAGVVTDNGNGGTVGGIGDGMIGTDAAAPPGPGPRTAVVPKSESAKYEIFRIVSYTATSLVLDSGKRLSSYFSYNIGAESPIIRAITIIQPAATRLVAVPGSGETGQEQVFAFVPPKAALNADMQPPKNSWTTTGLVDPWTASKGFDTDHGWGTMGVIADYAQDFAIPIPTPVNRGTGRLQGINGEVPAQLNLGQMRVILDPTTPFDAIADVGRIIHIHDIRRVKNGIWETSATGSPTHIGKPEMDRLLGYFEIFAAGANGGGGADNYYDVRMVSQFDPDTGAPFYGSASILVMATGSAVGDAVNLQWTLHDPIESLWTDLYLHPTRLDSARLKNLIDPRWVQPTLKGRELADMAGHPALPDKAVFATGSSNAGASGSNENPGSLMDLGFRVVFFPAKDAGAYLVPDFDNPIDANDVVLDPSKLSEKQFLEVDYSAGLVHLSHPPQPGSQLIPDAGIFSHVDNLRKEAVFFASCVPFSREPGQMGSNPRVTAGRSLGADGSFCLLNNPEPADVYGARLFWPGALQTLKSGPQQTIKLDVALLPIDIPETGFVDVLLGDNDPSGLPLHANANEDRLCTFGYTSVIYNDGANGNNTTLQGTFGGAASATTATVQPGVKPATVVLRRNIVIPNTLDNRAGTDYQFDTTYGYAKRALALRFRHGSLQPESDGSVTLSTKDPRTDSHQALFSELFSSWCISGGVNQTPLPSVDATLHFSSVVVLIQGIRSVLPEQDVSVPLGASTFGYIYIDGSDPSCPTYATTTSLPLPNSDDVLLASYTADAIKVLTLIDLRNPLVDVDKRLDITVGKPLGHAQPGDAHFAELADAVAFVTETYRSVASSGGGSDGRFRRIKVIGPTLEDPTKLPIAPSGHHGIIIEGAGWPVDELLAAPMAITWNGDAKALFDLSGTSGWQFRNLVFRYDPGGTTSATVDTRNLFRVVDGLASDHIFENVLLNGPAHGFFYSLNPGTTLDRMIFRNCQAHELTDFAVRVKSDVAACDDMAFYGCEFTVETGAKRELDTVITNGGNIHIEFAGTQVVIRDCHIIGGNVGIQLSTTQSTIEGCLIQGTNLPAIWINSDFWAINNNYLQGVHTKAGTVGPGNPRKVAVWIPANQSEIHISQNEITVSLGATGDMAVSATAAGLTRNCIVSGNLVDWDIHSGEDYVVSDNTLTGGDLRALDRSIVRGNVIAGSLLTNPDCNVSDNVVGDLLLGSLGTQCHYSGNWFKRNDVTSHVAGATSDFHGDWFGANGSSGGRLTLANDCIFDGCFFTDGFSGSPISNKFNSCKIDIYSAEISIVGSKNQFTGCIIQDRSAVGLNFQATGDTNVFTGNHFRVDTLWLSKVGAGDLTVVGNYFDPGTNGGGIYIVADGSVISDNVVKGWETASTNPNLYSIFVLGAGNVVSGNACTKGLRVAGANAVVTGNHVTTDAFLDMNLSSFKSNKVVGNVIIKGAAAVLGFNDNHVEGTLDYDAVASYLVNSTFVGNQIDGVATLTPDGGGPTPSIKDTVISGNTFKAAFTATASEDCTFTGNRCLGAVTLTSAIGLLCNNNRVGKLGASANLILTSCDDYICNGNYVTGSILVDANTSGTGAGALVGNRANVVATNNAPITGQIVIGNRTTNNGAIPSLFNVDDNVVTRIANMNSEV